MFAGTTTGKKLGKTTWWLVTQLFTKMLPLFLCFFFKYYTLKRKSRSIFKFVSLFWSIWLQTRLCLLDKQLRKTEKNRQKGRNSGRVLKSRRVEYLENKLPEVKNNYTIEFVSSIRIFWYITRLYSVNFEKWPYLTFDLEFWP